jgi:hypothetical protein
VVIEGDDIDGTDWVLCQPTGTTSPWWTIMKKFHPLKYPGMKDKAACMLCFEAGIKSKGTISISGKSTTGLMRHMQNHHQKEYENIKSDAAKKKINTGIPTKSITEMFPVQPQRSNTSSPMISRSYSRLPSLSPSKIAQRHKHTRVNLKMMIAGGSMMV